jgi:hypothetical protein
MHLNTATRVVAFVDIIGWKSAFDNPAIGHEGLVKIATWISKHSKQFSLEKKKELREWDKNHIGKQLVIGRDYYDISFSFLSDSFIISASPNHLHSLFGVIQWDCMQLLQMHGLLTRGGITMGEFTHDMSNDIVIGIPLNEAVAIERSTKMPRIVVESEVVKLAKQSLNCEQFIYYDGECSVLNITNRSTTEVWLRESKEQIDTALNSDLSAYKKCKWKYISEHLPRMNTTAKSKPV